MKKTLTLGFVIVVFTCCYNAHEVVESEKTLVDFFLPFEQQTPLVSNGIWGDSSVLPRDTANGLEDVTLKNWCYWDGSIIKDERGKYHMYASRWGQEFSHSDGWKNHSKGVHAVSDNLFGPYKDMGMTWPNQNHGLGHNVVGLRMDDGRYAVISSERTPGDIWVSDSAYGPFEYLGAIKIDANGYYPGWGRYDELNDGAVKGGGVGRLSNVMIISRPDGRYMLVARYCVPMISDNGILGPYKMMAEKAWLDVERVPQFNMEDPTVWYSDSLYHIVVNFHGVDSAFHLTSDDGIHNWKNRGLAFHRSRNVFRHKDGIVEDWFTVQRPTVYVENGKIEAFNFSVIDVHKGKDKGEDMHGSKIIVVPFDGESFSKHMQQVIEKESRKTGTTPAPTPWQSVDIGSASKLGTTGYDELVNTIHISSAGNKLDSKEDAFRFVYQKMSGDISCKVMLLSDDISGRSVQSGLMIRKSLDAPSPFVLASFTKNGDFKFSKRTDIGSLPIDLKTKNLKSPYWMRFEKRGDNITCYVSTSNRMNWTEVGSAELKLDEDFYIGMVSTSNGVSQQSLARFKDVDAHQLGSPRTDGIVSHTFPDTITSSGIIDFEVELESVQALDIWVELQNVQTLEKYKVLRQRCWKGGTYKLTYNAGKELDPNNSYWFVIKAVPKHAHDSEHVDSGFKKVFIK